VTGVSQQKVRESSVKIFPFVNVAPSGRSSRRGDSPASNRHMDCVALQPSARQGGCAMQGDRFQVRVELMDDPCLSRWEICDPARKGFVADSGPRDWTAADSRKEAYRAGRARLNSDLPPVR